MLADAEVLLRYAAESGVELDAALTAHVLAGRLAEAGAHWTLRTAENLMAAFTSLSARLRPITAETLRLCANERKADRITRPSKLVAVALALLILPFSVATFATSAISVALKQDLKTANALAVTLSNELPPPPEGGEATKETAIPDPPGSRKGAGSAVAHGASQKEVIEHLQEIAAITRSVYTRGKQLNWFVGLAVKVPAVIEAHPNGSAMKGHIDGAATDRNGGAASDPSGSTIELELSPGLPDLTSELTTRILAYQQIRQFAQTADGLVSTFYGAFATCVLPVLYALLGASAYLLRMFEEQLRTRTLTDSDGHIARFVIAGIAGAVIGLFNNLNFGQPASVSPLAIAFLVGYAVDVFFAFLEGLIQSFSRQRSGAQSSSTSLPTPAEGRGR
jgi:hypothetical protein